MQTNFAYLILSYNHPDLTDRTVQSVLRLNIDPQRIFLVHNGSEKKHVEWLIKKNPSIQHVLMEKNLGFSGGINFGCQEVFKNHDWLFFLTNDTELIKSAEVFPAGFDVLTPKILKRNTEQIDSLIGVINTQSSALRHVRDLKESIALEPHEKYYVPGSAFGLSKKCFNQLQGFDETFHTYWEDVDFGLRAGKLGFEIKHSNEFELKHKVGKTCHKDRFYTLYLFQRNRRKLMCKHHYLNLIFILNYSKDMLRYFFRIFKQENKLQSLNYWWKALTD